MRAIRRRWRKALAVLALLGAGTAVSASAPVGDHWVADPDEQYMLDVNIHHLTLGDGARAYGTPEGTCIVFGDFLQALDVPMKIDLQAHKASGWAFKQTNTITIDASAHSVTHNGKSESFSTTDIREVPEGWCIDSKALARWFALDLSADTSVSMLTVESKDKLPVELAMERRNRAGMLKKDASLDLSGIPSVRLPYRMWRAPALEFIVNAGVTYQAKTGARVDRSASVYAAGEIAAMSYSAAVQGDLGGLPTSIRATLYRSDPDGGLLGPLKATHIAVGDVEGLASAFGGGTGSGRGAVITNRPLTHPGTFDRTEFTGELAPGWDAELYRNGSLIGFYDGQDNDGRYHFRDVDMLYGDNEFDVILYGPQGQVEHRREDVNIGRDNVPPGQLWYWAGARQPGTDLISFAHKTDPPPGTTAISNSLKRSAPELTVDAQYGVDDRMSVGALIRSTVIQDERVTFVEGSVRRSLGAALVEIAGAVDTHGRMAGRAQLIAKLGSVNVHAASFYTNGFGTVSDKALKSEQRLGLSAPVKLGSVRLPVGADVRLLNRIDGTSAIDASTRLGAQIGRFNLSSETRYTRELKRQAADGDITPEKLETSLIGTARFGRVRLRGLTRFDLKPQSRFRSAEMTASWSAGEHSDWEGGLAYEADFKRVRARVSHVHRFDMMGVALTGEAASDGSVAAGVSLSFSMDPFRGNFRPTSDRLASSGAVRARVYEDLNENGRRDAGEPVAAKALITAGMRPSDRATDKGGEVTLGGLAPYVPVAIGIDQTSLDNPALTAEKPAQLIIPRPGVSATVDIALVGGGSVEGFAVREDHREFEGLDIELIDAAGRVIATARTDLDGYFLYERVRYGQYRLRLTAETAAAIHAPRELQATIDVTHDRPLARIGMVTVKPAPQLATADR
ncbi:MAG: hypothetical protein ABIT69_10340 [Sphingomicrobium sp.]